MGIKNPTATAGPAARLAKQGEYTVAQAAEMIGRTPGTVRRWIVSGQIKPRRVQCGQQNVNVFNKAELADLRAFSKTVKTGRPKVGATPMTTAKKAPAKVKANGAKTKKASTAKAPAKKVGKTKAKG